MTVCRVTVGPWSPGQLAHHKMSVYVHRWVHDIGVVLQQLDWRLLRPVISKTM